MLPGVTAGLTCCQNHTCRAKISMRLSSKNSEGSGLRKISSLRSGVSSPNGGAGSPFQPASQKAMPSSGPEPPTVSSQSSFCLAPLAATWSSVGQQCTAEV